MRVLALLTLICFLQINFVFGQDWLQKGQTIYGDESNDLFTAPSDLNYNGDVMVIGSPYLDESSYVEVYEFVNSEWSLKGQRIEAEGCQESVGNDVAINADGNTIVFSTPTSECNSINNSGGMYAYEFNGTEWVLKGEPIFGDSEWLLLGQKVSINGSGDIIVGTVSTLNGNEALAYEYNGTDWELMGDGVSYDVSFPNQSLKIDSIGETIILGAYGTSTYPNGAAQVLKWNGETWELKGEVLIDESIEGFGRSVSMSADGNVVSVSSSYYQSPGLTILPITKVYEWGSNEWQLIGDPIPGSFASGGLSNDGKRISVKKHLSTEDFNLVELLVYEFNETAWEELGQAIESENLDQLGSRDISGDGFTIINYTGLTMENEEFDSVTAYSIENSSDISGDLGFDPIIVYPNPSLGADIISLKVNGAIESIETTDVRGRALDLDYTQHENAYELDISEFKSGIFFLKIRLKESIVFKKLIIN